MLKCKDKEIVVPGEVLCEGMDFLPSHGTYRDDKVIRSSMVGMVNVDGKVIKIMPTSGRYFPRRGDTIIGRVFDITMNGWRLNINSSYPAFLTMMEASSQFIKKGSDLSRIIPMEGYVVGKITNVTGQNLIDVTLKGPGLRKLDGGVVINVSSSKVPRIIGRQGSMIKLIKEATGCFITVGQNGLVWLSGEAENEVVAVKAIELINSDGHKSGLTDQVKKFLEKETGKKLEV